MIKGCAQHQDVVDRALDEHATDADLMRYADQVAGCAACQRLLAVGAGVHPALLHRPSTDEQAAIDARVQLDDAGIQRLRYALEPQRTSPWKWALVLASAALLLLWLRPAEVRAPIPPPSVVFLHAVPTGVDHKPTRSESQPDAPVFVNQDAVVDAASDWDPPAFEDLRQSTAKGPVLRELRLHLDGEPGVDRSIRLAVQSATAEVVSLCVAGQENGVVWRGGVPGGRTVLTRKNRAVRYRFPRAGSYRFSLALGDSCQHVVHQLQVIL